MNKEEAKKFRYIAPPNGKTHLSDYEQQTLAIVKEFGSTTISQILGKLMPDYDPADKNPPFKKRMRIVFTVNKVAIALITLARADCVRVD